MQKEHLGENLLSVADGQGKYVSCRSNGTERTTKSGILNSPLFDYRTSHITAKAIDTVENTRGWWEHPPVWGAVNGLVGSVQEGWQSAWGDKWPWHTDRHTGAGALAPKGRCPARRRENRAESDPEEGRSERGQETRSHVLKGEGHGDKWFQSTSTAPSQGRSAELGWRDDWQEDAVQSLLRVETGGCRHESKWPAAMKIALTDTSARKLIAFAEWESQSSIIIPSIQSEMAVIN